jgi:DNA-binding response OmpR family regulator
VLTALELGATDHVAKPFSVAVLMRRVERVLER